MTIASNVAAPMELVMIIISTELSPEIIRKLIVKISGASGAAGKETLYISTQILHAGLSHRQILNILPQEHPQIVIPHAGFEERYNYFEPIIIRFTLWLVFRN